MDLMRYAEKTAADLAQHWERFRDEAVALPQTTFFTWWATQNYTGHWDMYPLVDRGEGPMPTDEDGRILGFAEKCPFTTDHLLAVQEVTAAAFSRVSPGSRIIPHSDVYDQPICRIHLGLVAGDGCTVWVDGTPHAHRPGETVVFDTRSLHSVENTGDRDRIILIVDIGDPAEA
ncbi:MAG TPA: aspartyl/asparaginyl beta-hydroxylase domain-containing protein [Planctomycetes bacterium]|nr:aspartyl/asparaginyl beta-hydroxylase domain-containing protein [Planctomycetota bacterium]